MKAHTAMLAAMLFAATQTAHGTTPTAHVISVAPEQIGAQWFYPEHNATQITTGVAGAALGGVLGAYAGTLVGGLLPRGKFTKDMAPARRVLEEQGDLLKIPGLQDSLLDGIVKPTLKRLNFHVVGHEQVTALSELNVDGFEPLTHATDVMWIAEFFASVDAQTLIVFAHDVALTPGLESLEVATELSIYSRSDLKERVLYSKSFDYQNIDPVFQAVVVYQSDFVAPNYSFARSIPLVHELYDVYANAQPSINGARSRDLRWRAIKKRDRTVEDMREDAQKLDRLEGRTEPRDWSANGGERLRQEISKGLTIIPKYLAQKVDEYMGNGGPTPASETMLVIPFADTLTYFTSMEKTQALVHEKNSDHRIVELEGNVVYAYDEAEVPRLWNKFHRQSLYKWQDNDE